MAEPLTRNGEMKMTIELPTHPTSGLQAIGFRRNGDPIWPIMGGSEDHDADADKDADKGSTGDADDSNGDDGDNDSGDDDKGAAGDSGAKDGKTDDKPAGPDWKSRSRQNEAGKKAAEKKLNAVLSALGINGDDNLTPQQLKEKFEAADAETKGLKVENAVIKAASKAGVDADELTDSKKFMAEVAELDPTDKDFAADVKKLIDAEVKRKPSLKLGGSSNGSKGGSSGKEVTGNNGKGQLTRADLEKLSPKEIVEAQKAGRLDTLMGKK